MRHVYRIVLRFCFLVSESPQHRCAVDGEYLQCNNVRMAQYVTNIIGSLQVCSDPVSLTLRIKVRSRSGDLAAMFCKKSILYF